MNYDKEYYISKLIEVYEREKRFPKKSDFSQEDVNKIKSFFGPWPWALETAGLKESKQEERKAKNIAKRQRSRERRKKSKTNISE